MLITHTHIFSTPHVVQIVVPLVLVSMAVCVFFHYPTAVSLGKAIWRVLRRCFCAQHTADSVDGQCKEKDLEKAEEQLTNSSPTLPTPDVPNPAAFPPARNPEDPHEEVLRLVTTWRSPSGPACGPDMEGVVLEEVLGQG